jgi:hypothetical protein
MNLLPRNNGDTQTFDDITRTSAMRLHTDVYLGAGYISDTDLNPEGLYEDKYASSASYFYRSNEHKRACARQIPCVSDEGLGSLPTLKHFKCYPEELSKAYGTEDILDISPGNVVEISGLGAMKNDGTTIVNDLDGLILLYGDMLRHSAEHNHSLWVMNIEEKMAKKLGKLIGEDMVYKIGESKQYIGPPTTPYAINPKTVMMRLLDKESELYPFFSKYYAEVFDGADAKFMDPELVDLFVDSGFSLSNVPDKSRPGSFRKTLDTLGLSNKAVGIGSVAVLGYSVSRSIAAGNYVDEFQGNPLTLAAIDISTVVPYVKGLEMSLTKGSIRRKVGGWALASAAFISPYAYFYSQSGNEGYPNYINGIVAAMAGTAAGSELLRRNKNKTKREELFRQIESED